MPGAKRIVPDVKRFIATHARADARTVGGLETITKFMDEAVDLRQAAEDKRDGESIDTFSYTVSPSTPWLLSLPLVGHVLAFLDSLALGLERIGGRALRRVGVKLASESDNDGWSLLQTFQSPERVL